MTTAQPEGIAAKVVKELPKFFQDGFDQLTTGEGEYIRSGEPKGQAARIGQAVARSYCRQYGADPGAARFGNAVRIENACRPYLDDTSPGDGPQLSPAFQGGQCDSLYRGNIQQTTSPGGAVFTSPDLRIQGPFDLRVVVESPTSGRVDLNTRRWYFAGATAPPLGAQSWQQFSAFTTPVGGSRSVDIINLVRVPTGSLDDCGNPPIRVRPPRSIPDSTGPSFRFNPSADLDIPINVEINPDGTVTVDIGTGPVDVDLFPPEGSGGGGGGGGSPPGDVGEPDADGAEDADEEGVASGCAGENQVLGGLKVDITRIPTSARQFAPGIYRGAAYIYMGVEGNLDQDFGGSMMKDGQFYLPEKDNLTCWEVHANFGYRLRVTPYYKTLEDDGSTAT